jgi:hypothetical protein
MSYQAEVAPLFDSGNKGCFVRWALLTPLPDRLGIAGSRFSRDERSNDSASLFRSRVVIL